MQPRLTRVPAPPHSRVVPATHRAGTTSLFVSQQTQTLIRRLHFERCLLVKIDAGDKRITSAHRSITACTESIVVIPPSITVDITNIPAAGPEGEYRARVLILGEDAAPTHGGEAERVMLREPMAVARPSPSLSAVFDRVYRTLGSPHHYPAQIRDLRTQELTAWIEHSLGYRLPLESAASEQTITARLRRMVRKDLAADWNCASVASAMAMSEATLRRRLRVRQTSFAEELLEARLSHALQLLQTVDWSIEAIAASVGYASPSRFAERFRERFDLPPSAFRKKISA